MLSKVERRLEPGVALRLMTGIDCFRRSSSMRWENESIALAIVGSPCARLQGLEGRLCTFREDMTTGFVMWVRTPTITIPTNMQSMTIIMHTMMQNMHWWSSGPGDTILRPQSTLIHQTSPRVLHMNMNKIDSNKDHAAVSAAAAMIAWTDHQAFWTREWLMITSHGRTPSDFFGSADVWYHDATERMGSSSMDNWNGCINFNWWSTSTLATMPRL